MELDGEHLPGRAEPSYPPPHKLWSKKHPEVAARYARVREAVGTRAEELSVPTENLLTPSLLRRYVWEHTGAADPDEVSRDLTELGARPWQVEITAPVILTALATD